MRPLRRTLLVALLASGALLAASVPVSVGQLNLTITGVATCDPSTATTTISWNIQANQGGANVVATQTPSGETLTVTPNPLVNGANSATGTVPGGFAGAVTLSVVAVGGPPFTGSVNVDVCVAPAPAVQAAADFTG